LSAVFDPPQLILDLGCRSASGAADFLLTPGNQDAVAWLDAWPDWPAPAIVIFGPPGCGKSHLGQIWRMRAKGNLLGVRDLLNEPLPDLLRPGRTALLDNADQTAGDPTLERALLHLYNLAQEARGHLVLLSRTAPVNWVLRLPDLRSRLQAIPAIGMAEADDSLLMAVLVKLFADRQVRVKADVIRWLMTRTERSFENARAMVARLDAAALAVGKPVTVALCRQALGATPPTPSA
jgi:chromosomal replication initiation ATPase DnaA